MITELLPCPFCGGQANKKQKHGSVPSLCIADGKTEVIYKEYCEYIVDCKDCGASVSSFISMDKAIEKWNKRIKTKKGK